MRLYHFTCDHGRPGILADGFIRPHPHPFLNGPPILWLTDLADPLREPLGLTNDHTKCDRAAYRFVVETDEAEWWPAYCRRRRVPGRIREQLEFFGLPAHWYVAESELAAVEA